MKKLGGCIYDDVTVHHGTHYAARTPSRAFNFITYTQILMHIRT